MSDRCVKQPSSFAPSSSSPFASQFAVDTFALSSPVKSMLPMLSTPATTARRLVCSSAETPQVVSAPASSAYILSSGICGIAVTDDWLR